MKNSLLLVLLAVVIISAVIINKVNQQKTIRSVKVKEAAEQELINRKDLLNPVNLAWLVKAEKSEILDSLPIAAVSDDIDGPVLWYAGADNSDKFTIEDGSVTISTDSIRYSLYMQKFKLLGFHLRDSSFAFQNYVSDDGPAVIRTAESYNGKNDEHAWLIQFDPKGK